MISLNDSPSFFMFFKIRKNMTYFIWRCKKITMERRRKKVKKKEKKGENKKRRKDGRKERKRRKQKEK